MEEEKKSIGHSTRREGANKLYSFYSKVGNEIDRKDGLGRENVSVGVCNQKIVRQ